MDLRNLVIRTDEDYRQLSTKFDLLLTPLLAYFPTDLANRVPLRLNTPFKVAQAVSVLHGEVYSAGPKFSKCPFSRKRHYCRVKFYCGWCEEVCNCLADNLEFWCCVACQRRLRDHTDGLRALCASLRLPTNRFAEALLLFESPQQFELAKARWELQTYLGLVRALRESHILSRHYV